ncbi:MAG: type II secretion system protein [Planctomycetes bacterium]|nr:type II secretion system protein [Planctomycetota bacterium]
MIALSFNPSRCDTTPQGPPRPRRRGFSMTELLVVIGIIAVLAGILLVAMRGVRVRAKYTQTESTMQSFMAACDSFQMEHGRYPGVVPESVFANPGGTGPPPISGTENALLDLMGGVIRGDDPQYGNLGGDWDEIVVNGATLLGQIKVNRQLIGEGPVINGQPYAPYFTPGDGEFRIAKGQMVANTQDVECCPSLDADCNESGQCLPDLLDAWGQPIIYVRRARTTGPLVAGSGPGQPQFLTTSMTPYTTSTALGELGKDQSVSIFNTSAAANATFGQTIRHPAFGAPNDPLTGTARGAYVLISAGPDGIFFSKFDGPGTPTAPVENIVTNSNSDLNTPRVVQEYDDIRRFGGG